MHDPTHTPDYSQIVVLELSIVETSIAGPQTPPRPDPTPQQTRAAAQPAPSVAYLPARPKILPCLLACWLAGSTTQGMSHSPAVTLPPIGPCNWGSTANPESKPPWPPAHASSPTTSSAPDSPHTWTNSASA